MHKDDATPASGGLPPDRFHTTSWSLVLAAGQSADDPSARSALGELCQEYWLPLYLYVRHRCRDAHEAQDLTQAFFAMLLERQTIAQADPDRGRFRAFLLTACKRFLINQRERERAVKRGGRAAILSLDFELAESRYAAVGHSRTPEIAFERQWAMTLLETVLQHLREEYADRGKVALFEALKPLLVAPRAVSHSDLAMELRMQPVAVKVAAHRFRTRYRELIREAIARTVDGAEAVEDEIRRLFSVLAQD